VTEKQHSKNRYSSEEEEEEEEVVVVVAAVAAANKSEGFLEGPYRHLDNCCSIVSPHRLMRLRDQAKPCVSHYA
jgi:hypothetical protein